MIRTFGGKGALREIVFIKDPYTSSPEETVMKEIKLKYENRVIRDAYILKVTELLKFSEWRIAQHNNEGSVFSKVIFKCEVLSPQKGDIIVGAICKVAGQGKEIPRLVKSKMCISVTLNNNIEKLLLEQKITVRIKEIAWEPYSDIIDVVGSLTHAKVFPSKVYAVTPKIVKKHKQLIKEYNVRVEELQKQVGNSPMKERSYPFSKLVTKYDKPVSFIQVFDDMINDKIDKVTKLVDCCFLPREAGQVYILNSPVNESKSLNCIVELYEGLINALMMIIEMDLEYKDWPKYLDTFYTMSKKQNDPFIERIYGGLIVK